MKADEIAVTYLGNTLKFTRPDGSQLSLAADGTIGVNRSNGKPISRVSVMVFRPDGHPVDNTQEFPCGTYADLQGLLADFMKGGE